MPKSGLRLISSAGEVINQFLVGLITFNIKNANVDTEA